MTESRPHPAPAYAHTSARHHPYAPPPHHRQSPVSQHSGQQNYQAPRRPSPGRGPPSPPCSRRDDDSPPLSTKIDQGDNYWDDVPAAPASLKSILDSFRRSGEGDRDLLLSILGAKKSEEERLTAIIQTRLTVLQARLNLSAMQAQTQMVVPLPEPRQERTPSLTSQSSAESPVPPPAPQYYVHSSVRDREPERDRAEAPRLRERPRQRDTEREDRERIHLPAPMGYEREQRLAPINDDRRYATSPRRSNSSNSASSGVEHREREREREPRDLRDRESRRSAGAGLDMLLEGVREAERDGK